MTVLALQKDSAYMTWTDGQGAVPASLYQWPLLLTWINFNHSNDKQLHAQKSVGWNYSSIPKVWMDE